MLVLVWASSPVPIEVVDFTGRENSFFVQPLQGVREALFSILGNRLTNCRFFFFNSGTGAVGIEAVSRGAAHVTFVESKRDALKLLRQNLELCHIGEEIAVVGRTIQQYSTLSRSVERSL